MFFRSYSCFRLYLYSYLIKDIGSIRARDFYYNQDKRYFKSENPYKRTFTYVYAFYSQSILTVCCVLSSAF